MDPRFVGHVHALRLALTDPRFPAAAAPGALTAQPAARPALTRALAALAEEPGGGPVRPRASAAPPQGRAETAATAGTDASAATSTAPAAATGTDGAAPAGTATRTEADPSDTGVSGSPGADADGSGARPAAPDDSLPDLLAARLDADGTAVHRPVLGSLVAAVPTGPQARKETRDAVAAVDDEAVRLRAAVKSRDGFFTTFFISPHSRYLARWCARRGLTPNQVTTASLLTALAAAGCAATGTRGGFVAAGLLLLLSFVLDCADGQLARYSLQYSTLGAWLDATFDRVKEYAYYAGLALGAARGGDDVWALALGAMVLQTCRHVVDFSFNEANHDATANTSPTAALSDRLDSVGWTVWIRRMIILPIGERWAMIAVLTALTTPRTVFYALLAGCAFAACYTTAGRVLRSLTRKAHRTDRAAQALADLADSGPLAELLSKAARGSFPPAATRTLIAAAGAAWLLIGAALAPLGNAVLLGAVVYVLTSATAVGRPLKGPLDWLVPPLFRAAEYLTVLILAARSGAPGALPAAFGLVAAVAYHHYDTVYRIRGGTGAPPAWLVRTLGGHDGRTLLVVVLAVLFATGGPGDGGDRFTLALTALAGALALVGLAESVRFWVSAGAPAVHDEGETA
ncbi:transferase [Streptomyces sp. CC53]|nr:transferase [Streptomyces sp. CC53]